MAGRGLTGTPRLLPGRLGLACLSVALTALSAVFLVRSALAPDTGLVVMFPEVTVENGSVLFNPRAPFSAATASGLRPRLDRILSIDGKQVRSSWDVLQAHRAARGFRPFPVEVLRDGELVTVQVTPVFAPSRPDWYLVLAFCVVLAVTAALLTWRLPASPATVLLVLASLLYLLFTCVKPFYYDSLLANCLVQAGKLTPWLLVLFGLYFPFRRGSPAVRAAVIAALLAGWAALFAVRTGLYVQWAATGAEAFLDRYRQLGRILNAAEGGSYVAWGALMASAYLLARTEKEKAQLRWILAGILVALPPYFLFDQLPLILRQPRVSLGNFAQLFLSFIPACTLIGLTRHRVFSLRFFLSRVIVGAAMLVAAGTLFGLAWQPLLQGLAEGWALAPAPAAFASGAVLFAALFPLRWAFVRLADLAVRRRGRGAADLERRNAELALLVEELARQESRTAQGRKLSELRVVLRGVVRGLRDPSRQLASALVALRSRLAESTPLQGRGQADAALAPALEAGARIAEVLRALEALAGPASAAPAPAGAETLVLTAVQRVRQRRPGAVSAQCACTGTISCCAEELVNAIAEVIDNALDAQEGLPAPVRVRLLRERDRAVIEVEDDGPGPARETRGRLFTPFCSTKPGHQGLGLYMARMVVERNDGCLDLDAGVDGGALARLVLPLEGAG
jgi:signal transduction histidine kinase